MRRNHIPVGLFLLIGAVLAWDWQYTHGPAWYGCAG